MSTDDFFRFIRSMQEKNGQLLGYKSVIFWKGVSIIITCPPYSC